MHLILLLLNYLEEIFLPNLDFWLHIFIKYTLQCLFCRYTQLSELCESVIFVCFASSRPEAAFSYNSSLEEQHSQSFKV